MGVGTASERGGRGSGRGGKFRKSGRGVKGLEIGDRRSRNGSKRTSNTTKQADHSAARHEGEPARIGNVDVQKSSCAVVGCPGRPTSGTFGHKCTTCLREVHMLCLRELLHFQPHDPDDPLLCGATICSRGSPGEGSHEKKPTSDCDNEGGGYVEDVSPTMVQIVPAGTNCTKVPSRDTNEKEVREVGISDGRRVHTERAEPDNCPPGDANSPGMERFDVDISEGEVHRRMRSWSMVLDRDAYISQEVTFKQVVGLSSNPREGDESSFPVASPMANIRTISSSNVETLRKSFGRGGDAWKPSLGVAVFLVRDEDIGIQTPDEDVSFIDLDSESGEDPDQVEVGAGERSVVCAQRLYFYKKGKQPCLPSSWVSNGQIPEVPATTPLYILDGMGRMSFAAEAQERLVIHFRVYVIPKQQFFGMDKKTNWKDFIRMFVSLCAKDINLGTNAICQSALVQRAETCARERQARASAYPGRVKCEGEHADLVRITEEHEEEVSQPGYVGSECGADRSGGNNVHQGLDLCVPETQFDSFDEAFGNEPQLDEVPVSQRPKARCPYRHGDPIPRVSPLDVLDSYLLPGHVRGFCRYVNLNSESDDIGDNLGIKSVDLLILCGSISIIRNVMVHACIGCMTDTELVGTDRASTWAAEVLAMREDGAGNEYMKPCFSLRENAKDLKSAKGSIWMECLQEVFGTTLGVKSRFFAHPYRIGMEERVVKSVVEGELQLIQADMVGFTMIAMTGRLDGYMRHREITSPESTNTHPLCGWSKCSPSEVGSISASKLKLDGRSGNIAKRIAASGHKRDLMKMAAVVGRRAAAASFRVCCCLLGLRGIACVLGEGACKSKLPPADGVAMKMWFARNVWHRRPTGDQLENRGKWTDGGQNSMIRLIGLDQLRWGMAQLDWEVCQIVADALPSIREVLLKVMYNANLPADIDFDLWASLKDSGMRTDRMHRGRLGGSGFDYMIYRCLYKACRQRGPDTWQRLKMFTRIDRCLQAIGRKPDNKPGDILAYPIILQLSDAEGLTGEYVSEFMDGEEPNWNAELVKKLKVKRSLIPLPNEGESAKPKPKKKTKSGEDGRGGESSGKPKSTLDIFEMNMDTKMNVGAAVMGAISSSLNVKKGNGKRKRGGKGKGGKSEVERREEAEIAMKSVLHAYAVRLGKEGFSYDMTHGERMELVDKIWKDGVALDPFRKEEGAESEEDVVEVVSQAIMRKRKRGVLERKA